MTGIRKKISLPMEIAASDAAVVTGLNVGFYMEMDLELPFTLVAEGVCEVLVTVSFKVCHPYCLCLLGCSLRPHIFCPALSADEPIVWPPILPQQDMVIATDLFNGKINITAPKDTATGIVVNGHARVGGMVEIKATARVGITGCVFGPCVELLAMAVLRLQAGFDAVYGYAEDPAVRATFVDETHGNFMGRSLVKRDVSAALTPPPSPCFCCNLKSELRHPTA